MTDKLNQMNLNDLVIQIKNLSFSYDPNKGCLLQQLNMTFPRSSIYTLLGSSGCGKTTLIRLILGQLKPISGSIRINGKNQSHSDNKIPGIGVGFMPQELGLYNELTVLETFKYFAKLYGMSTEYTKTRIKFLVKFLELPDPNRMVNVLSGGQKRRTSLAVALIHNPPLLILDEPTTGVDPMLRQRIWKHLVELSSTEKISIMITTQHIEECGRAHVIALLRSGQLLFENSPPILMKHFETNNLKDVFLQSSKFEQQVVHPVLPPTLAQVRDTIGFKKPKGIPITSGHKSSCEPMRSTFFGRYSAFVIKNANKLWRQKLLLLVLIITPLISGTLLCISFGVKPNNLKVAVYNQELDEPTVPFDDILSLKLLEKIDKNIIVLKKYASNESALASVRNGTTYGALVISKGFSVSLIVRTMAENFAVTDQQIMNSTIQFYADTTDLMIFEAMQKTLLDAEHEFIKGLIKLMGHSIQSNPKAFELIIDLIYPPIFGSLDPSFRDLYVPGLLILNTYLFSMCTTALDIVGQRVEGTINRTLVTGAGMFEIILALITIQFFLIVIQTISLLYLTIGIFNIKNEGNLVLIVILIVLQNINGMTFGLMMSSFSNNKILVFRLCLGSFLTILMISGVIWPLEGMHYILRVISMFTPQTLPILSLRNIMLKGWALEHTLVWSGFFVSFCYLLIFIFLTTILSSFVKN